MKKEDLFLLKEKLLELNNEDLKERDKYLKGLANGTISGPPVGYPSIDKPWLKYYEDSYIDTDIPQMSVYRYLYEQNKDHLSDIALSYYGRKITFKELFDNIEKTAMSLKAMGVRLGEIVTILMPNTPEAVYLFYAMSKIGAVCNMIDPRTSSEGIEKYIKEADSKKVFIVDAYYEKIKTLIERKIVRESVAISPSESLPFGLNIGYKLKELLSKEPKQEFLAETMNWKEFINCGKRYVLDTEIKYKPNRPVVIEHTGGTTGIPKGVVLSNENINSVAVQSLLTGIDMKREHNWLDIMPTFIAYGVGMGLHLPLTIGMETKLIPQFDPMKFDELIIKHKPIHMVGVPSYWGTIIKSEKLKSKDLSYMIAPTVGGDAMDTNLEKDANKFLEEHNCTSKIVKGYGMTEVTGGVAGTVPDNNKIGSVGIPFVKQNISVFDIDTEDELGYNEQGEICITGPNTMLGYFDNPEETKKIIRTHSDGKKWVHTGDIGYITEDGSIFIVDRIKRMMIRYDGFKIFPAIIEKTLSLHEAVETCKVVSIADVNHSQGKLPKAHIILKEEYKGKEQIIKEELINQCKEQLPEYCQVVEYKFRDTLPLTSIGKVDYLALEREDSHIKNKTNIKTLKKTN